MHECKHASFALKIPERGERELCRERIHPAYIIQCGKSFAKSMKRIFRGELRRGSKLWDNYMVFHFFVFVCTEKMSTSIYPPSYAVVSFFSLCLSLDMHNIGARDTLSENKTMCVFSFLLRRFFLLPVSRVRFLFPLLPRYMEIYMLEYLRPLFKALLFQSCVPFSIHWPLSGFMPFFRNCYRYLCRAKMEAFLVLFSG